MIGYIQLHRKLIEWEWYHDVNTFKLFIHLLLKANFEPKKWQGIEIKRGQLVTSIKHLANETGLTDKQVRSSLDKLIKTKEVGKQTTSQNTTLTILSYDLYQQEGKPKANKKANEGQTEGERRANEGQQLNKDNKLNKVNNENNINERKLKFAESIKNFIGIYGRELLNDFYLYWTEPHQTKDKMRFELCQTWAVESRLRTWAKRDKNFNQKNNDTRKPTINNSIDYLNRGSVAEFIKE